MNRERNPLYGRSVEINALREALDATTQRLTLRFQLVLLSGATGTGKRALISTALQPFIASGGFFSYRYGPPRSSAAAQCRFQPYTFSDLVGVGTWMMNLDQATKAAVKLAWWSEFTLAADRERLYEILPSEVVDWLQEDAHIPPATAETTSTLYVEERTAGSHSAPNAEYALVLARFFYVVSSCVSIVIHLENFQHANVALVAFLNALLHLEPLLRPVEQSGLLIVVSYTAVPESLQALDGADPTNGLSGASNDTRRIHRLHVSNLPLEHVTDWVNDSLAGSDILSVKGITSLIYNHTDGNPLGVQFALGYLKHATNRDKSAMDKLPHCLEDWYLLALNEHPDSRMRSMVETIVAIEACRDDMAVVNARLLEQVLEFPVDLELAMAEECGFIAIDPTRGHVHLPMQEIQTASYALIPEQNRASIHLKIGRRIWKNSTLGTDQESWDDEASLCLVARQLERGFLSVSDSNERNVIVAIQCRAGKKAMQLSDFASASFFFNFAISAMGDLWTTDNYDTSLILHNYAAEAEYCTGMVEQMEERIQAVFTNARTFRDKLQAYTTLVYAKGGRNQLSEAVGIARHVLQELGEPIPSNPSTVALLVECFKTRRMLHGKTDRFFRSLRTATEPDKIAAMQMLNFTSIYSYLAAPKCGAMAVFRLVQLAIKHGLTDSAVSAFAAFGFLLGSQLGRIEEGYRYVNLSLALLDHCEARAWLPRIYFFSYGLLNRWVNPLRESMEPLRRAHRSALKTGDIEGSAITASSLMALIFYVGAPLSEMESEARSYCQLMDSFGQSMCLLFLVPRWSFFCDISGKSVAPLSLTGDITDAHSALSQAVLEGNKSAVYTYYINRTMCSCLLGEYSEAMEMAKKARASASNAEFGLVFFEGVAALALAREDKRRTRRQRYMSTGRRDIYQLRKWTRICPANFRNKLHLLEAELATVTGDSTNAINLFDWSIKAARSEGFIQEEGLAFERLAVYHLSLDQLHSATPYFERARDAYKRWGSERLVGRMDDKLNGAASAASCS